ncbi:hypothetical protein ELS19_01370 [Halogeometricum borinquense]|uniref:Uncharacterized protein n=1 Tax=Halogeometricum borinquense TaxID=60847 RepID=A0A482T556_9EURY|nr:hypothetical protein [Halogeometricum borinquense]RYJ12750.1 hypothetical protein ELS19_01370 [Halogeometricum borinquense]
MEMKEYPPLYGEGQKRSVVASELDQVTLTAGQENTIWAKKVAQDKALFAGHGPEVRDYAKAFIHSKLVASGNGAGTAGDVIDGDLIVAITDSEQRRVIASYVIGNLGDLADALTSDRTDRPVMAAIAPYAKPGRHLEFRVFPSPGSDGLELDPAESDARLYYSEVSN